MMLSDRIRAFSAARLYQSTLDPQTMLVKVTAAPGAGAGLGFGAAALGTMALTLMSPDTGMRIDSVDDWRAYSDRQVFLPPKGGSFTVRLVDVHDTANLNRSTTTTRVNEIGMRMKLLSATSPVGARSGVSFSVVGRGKVKVLLSDACHDTSCSVAVECVPNAVSKVDLHARLVTVQFAARSVHGCTVTYKSS
jgi:hypothetical protein